jgi:hypothetical protein
MQSARVFIFPLFRLGKLLSITFTETNYRELENLNSPGIATAKDNYGPKDPLWNLEEL